jgi:3-keto-5-aminohexanoate cleavage enzyme
MIARGTPVIISCALIGGPPSSNPHHPRTLTDIVRNGVEAARAGATVLHIHARTENGVPTQDSGVYEAIARAIRADAPDVILNFTTGGNIGMSAEERLASLQAQPDLASLDAGTLNVGESIFENSAAFIERAAREMRRLGVKAEIECFEAGMVATGERLITSGLVDTPALFQLVLGVQGGAPARVDTLCHLVALIPQDANWAAVAVGAPEPHFATMAAALAMGGHVRTGLEVTAYIAPGRYGTNAELVSRAGELCAAVCRPVATPLQAREILGLDRAERTAAAPSGTPPAPARG